jgi:hypothetical protein
MSEPPKKFTIVKNPYASTVQPRRIRASTCTDQSTTIVYPLPPDTAVTHSTTTQTRSSLSSSVPLVTPAHKKRRTTGNGPPQGHLPLKSIKWVRQEGPVQKTMTQFAHVDESTDNHFNSPPQPHRSSPSNSFHSRMYDSSRSEDEENEQVALEDEVIDSSDPRGYCTRPAAALRQLYCEGCKCTKALCHNVVFGRYVQLQIVHEVSESEDEPELDDIDDLFHEKYNRALRYKIFEATGTLDTSVREIPECLSTNSLETLGQYLKIRDYHYTMHKAITVGRDAPKFAQWRMFETPEKQDGVCNQEQERSSEKVGYGELQDPRGYRVRPTSGVLGQLYCTSCRCIQEQCHEVLFGRYLQLQLVDKASETEGELSFCDVENLFHVMYQEVLQYKIFEATDTLDTSVSVIPQCLRLGSLEALNQYLIIRDYHYKMHRAITMGRDDLKTAQGRVCDNSHEDGKNK